MTSLVDILNQIPTSLVGRAKPILDTMLVSRHLLRWDRNLELVIKGNVVPDTNVPELIVHALQPISMGDKAPNGFAKFIACLRILGLESQYVENEYADQVLDADGLDSSDSDNSDSDVDSDNDANPDENPDEDNEDVEGESEELESDNENIDGDEELPEQTGEMEQKVQWLQMEDGEGGEGEEDNADVEEVEGNQKVEWLEMDDGDGDIYINSDGYYKRV